MENGNLLTIKNFAKQEGVTTQYIYILMGKGEIEPTMVDDRKFIDISKYNGIKKS